MMVGSGLILNIWYLDSIILNVVFCDKWKRQIPLKLKSSKLLKTSNFHVNNSQ